jgi:hypothetical protein
MDRIASIQAIRVVRACFSERSTTGIANRFRASAKAGRTTAGISSSGLWEESSKKGHTLARAFADGLATPIGPYTERTCGSLPPQWASPSCAQIAPNARAFRYNGKSIFV